MNYKLPTELEIGGVRYNIRSDFRPALDILTALGDPELTDEDKANVVVRILYPDWKKIPRKDIQEAVNKGIWFIAGGKEDDGKKSPRLMDWEQDFEYIIAPVNRIAGTDLRGQEYVHWWTFLSYYYEIGECAFSQIVSIRQKRKKGKKLEKWEQEWYRDNRDAVDLKAKYTKSEDDIIAKWTKGE
ncbi:MAG: hypothetical protein IKE23_07015 [Exiguobacterium sp.]|nr:hypothetical protein [Exiguobacterium sp.]